MTDWKKDREVIDAATPGPWEMRTNEFSNTARHRWIWTEYGFIGKLDSESWESDGAFVIAARTRWPAALDRIAELEKQLEDLRARFSIAHECLDEITFYGLSRPRELGEGDDGDGHYRRAAQNLIAIAANGRRKLR